MLLPCSRALAIFVPEGIRMARAAPAEMQWDEHGGTFVLRVGGLEVSPLAEPELASGIWLEVALPLPEPQLAELRRFAGTHRLPLTSLSQPAELTETPMLAAAHVPGRNLFVYGEDAELHLRALGSHTLELSVTGSFKARRVPSQEPDVVIHLTAAAMARLLSYMLVLAG